MSSIRILLVEPYLTGSHRAWAEGYRAASACAVDVLALPGRFWKWRMHGGAVTLARRARLLDHRPDLILATDLLDLAAFLGLTRGVLSGVPAALFMHENQLAYPQLPVDRSWTPSRQRRAARRDAHYPWINLTSALAADVVLWNSDFNRRSFLAALPGFLGSFPDHRELDAPELIDQRSRVLGLGLDLRYLDGARPAARQPGPPRVVWNHRWEHDKDPGAFFRALEALADEGLDFQVIVLGEAFVRTPPEFEQARERMGARIIQFGYAADRADYARWLWLGDVVVSTAQQEFFGAAVCEAVYCGCLPVLPNRLAYPELIPSAYHEASLYDDPDGLQARLRAALTEPDEAARAALRQAMADNDWHAVAPRYDAALAELAGSVGTARGHV